MEAIVKRTLIGLVLAIAIGCSQSPTAPTSSSAALAGQLRWNVMSASCGPVTPPPTQPEFSTATITQGQDGSVTASWRHVTVYNRDVLLYAHFVRENGGWAMCSWDTADV
jgi:hypothetical protein